MFTTRYRLLAVSLLLALGLSLPALAANHGPGFGGAIQSGTCSALTEDTILKVNSGRDELAFLPYTVETEIESNANVYFGARSVPGFSPLTLLSGSPYSLVIHDSEADAVACGDIMLPEEKSFIDQGVILVQISPLPDSAVALNGVAILRAPAASDTDELTIAEVILVETTTGSVAPEAEATPNA